MFLPDVVSSDAKAMPGTRRSLLEDLPFFAVPIRGTVILTQRSRGATLTSSWRRCDCSTVADRICHGGLPAICWQVLRACGCGRRRDAANLPHRHACTSYRGCPPVFRRPHDASTCGTAGWIRSWTSPAIPTQNNCRM